MKETELKMEAKKEHKHKDKWRNEKMEKEMKDMKAYGEGNE